MNAMSKASYNAIIEESSNSGRAQEAAAIAHSIELMNGAEADDSHPKDTVIALHFTRRLWELLLRDLASPDNGLPRSLRADLISVGLGILRDLEKIRQRQKESFETTISLSKIIYEGLK